MFAPDELIAALADGGVEYVLTEGLAVGAHGFPRRREGTLRRRNSSHPVRRVTRGGRVGFADARRAAAAARRSRSDDYRRRPRLSSPSINQRTNQACAEGPLQVSERDLLGVTQWATQPLRHAIRPVAGSTRTVTAWRIGPAPLLS